MRSLFLTILRWKVRTMAKLTIWKYKPTVVGVTGSVGKTSSKEAITAVLSKEHRVRSNPANFNNELGMPLTIISDAKDVGRPVLWFWTKVLWTAFWRLFFRNPNYPEILVLEYGADRPGDINKLVRIARPNIAVVTAVGEIPVHVEFFAGPKAVAKEKSNLPRAVERDGFVVLNHDDITVLDMKSATRAHVLTYGLEEGADVRSSNFEHRIANGVPQGIGFKLGYGGSFLPVRIDDTFGKAQLYAAMAATAVAVIFEMNLVTIASALEDYEAPPGRMKLLHGLKNTLVLDDAYNASPTSMHAALDTMRDLPAKRKIAILGDMLEIGRYSMDAHKDLGRMAAKSIDILITVGPRGKFIAEGAHDARMRKSDIHSFDLAEEAAEFVHDMLEGGDLILLKASRAIGLETVRETIADPTHH